MQRLGQNFLKNKMAIEKIVAALDLKSGDVIVEIGAGHGELTDEIFNFSARGGSRQAGQFSISNKIKLIAIEKDATLVELLKKKFADNKSVEVVEGDALKILQPVVQSLKIENCKLKIVGNIPYYITGHLLRVIGELENKPALCVLTIQKEVAERIVAAPPKMNRLAASVQFWAEPEMLGVISRKDFSPQPEVDSAIIKLKVKSEKLKVGEKNYYEIMKVLFQQPRKTVLNNLATSDMQHATRTKVSERLEKIGINPQDRPQNLSVEDIIKISELDL